LGQAFARPNDEVSVRGCWVALRLTQPTPSPRLNRSC